MSKDIWHITRAKQHIYHQYFTSSTQTVVADKPINTKNIKNGTLDKLVQAIADAHHISPSEILLCNDTTNRKRIKVVRVKDRHEQYNYSNQTCLFEDHPEIKDDIAGDGYLISDRCVYFLQKKGAV